jgi:hypothetical protein
VDPQAGVTVKALTDREGMQANTTTRKLQILTLQLVILNDDDQCHKLLLAGTVHTRVTSKEIEPATYT